MKVTGSCRPSQTCAPTNTQRLRRAPALGDQGNGGDGHAAASIGRSRAFQAGIPGDTDAARGRGMIRRIIETDEDVAEGAAWLGAANPRFATALALTGPLPLQQHADEFPRRSSPPLSVSRSRPPPQPRYGRGSRRYARSIRPGLLAATDEALRAAGLSRQKDAPTPAPSPRQLWIFRRCAIFQRRGRAQPTRFNERRTLDRRNLSDIASLGRAADVFAPGDLPPCRMPRGGSSGLRAGRRRRSFAR